MIYINVPFYEYVPFIPIYKNNAMYKFVKTMLWTKIFSLGNDVSVWVYRKLRP
jgi:hypothetical protein